MAHIIEKLRELSEIAHGCSLHAEDAALIGAAAVEIERLMSALEQSLASGPEASISTDRWLRLVDENARLRAANERVGRWLSAALDDDSVCAEMKEDIQAWFTASPLRDHQGR